MRTSVHCLFAKTSTPIGNQNLSKVADVDVVDDDDVDDDVDDVDDVDVDVGDDDDVD